MLSSRSMELPLGVQSDIDLEMVFDVTETTGSISEIDAIARYSASFPYLVSMRNCWTEMWVRDQNC